jgi:serine protease inhibitor
MLRYIATTARELYDATYFFPETTSDLRDDSANVRVVDTIPETDPADLIPNLNSFGQQLAGQIPSSEENTFFSPFSISMALSMLLNGVTPNSKTYREMQTTVYQGLSVDHVNSGIRDTLQSMNGVDIACSVWVKPDLRIREEFTQKMETVFDAKPEKHSYSIID